MVACFVFVLLRTNNEFNIQLKNTQGGSGVFEVDAQFKWNMIDSIRSKLCEMMGFRPDDETNFAAERFEQLLEESLKDANISRATLDGAISDIDKIDNMIEKLSYTSKRPVNQLEVVEAAFLVDFQVKKTKSDSKTIDICSSCSD